MLLRSFRTILVLICLLGPLISWGALAVRAATPATHPGRSFQPSGHGVVIPQVVDTATTPQVQLAASASTLNIHAVPSNSAPVIASHRLLAPQTVVSVPPPSTSDLSAKKGLFKQGGKPDANGTGGPDNYLETVNGQLAIYTRGGTQQFTTTFQSWFGITTNFYDPVTMWDDTGGRLIFSVLQGSSPNLWLSVAQQTDATGKFCNYAFPTLPPVHNFDKLGVDADGIYFGADILASTSGPLMSNELFYASRTALESCQPATYTSWSGLTNPDGTLAEAITPARQDTSAGVEYLVNSYQAGACQLTLWTLTSGGTLSNNSVPTQCYSPSPKAKQAGSAALIDSGDCSVTQLSYVNGLLTLDTLGSYDWGDGNGPVGIVEWFVLNPSSASVSSQGAFGTPGYWLFDPSTVTTANGHMLFVFNASGPSIYPSVWYVNQTFTGAKNLAKGNSYYGTSGVSPWGDYQSAWPDASGGTPNAVWITGEFVKSTGVWGTKFDLVTP